jgi:hypothetical protein
MNKFEVSAKNVHSSRASGEMNPPHSISKLERIRLGGIDQWMRIQGKDTSNPVLLLIQQGPGFPMMNEAADASKLWHLENDFEWSIGINEPVANRLAPPFHPNL